MHEIAAAWVVVGGIFLAVGAFKSWGGVFWTLLGLIVMIGASASGMRP